MTELELTALAMIVAAAISYAAWRVLEKDACEARKARKAYEQIEALLAAQEEENVTTETQRRAEADGAALRDHIAVEAMKQMLTAFLTGPQLEIAPEIMGADLGEKAYAIADNMMEARGAAAVAETPETAKAGANAPAEQREAQTEPAKPAEGANAQEKFY